MSHRRRTRTRIDFKEEINSIVDKKVLICGVVKNVEKQIKFNIDKSLFLGKNFKDFKIIIYENNSTDNTKNILNSYSKNDKIKIISEDLENIKEKSIFWAYKEVTGSDHPCRIEQISNARNKILDEINKEDYEDYDYVIWIDLDGNGWNIKSFDFFDKDDWDVMYGNSNPYYDYYALRMIGDLDPCFLGERWWNYEQFHFDKLTPVWSAFNGIGIFKKEIFKENKYDFKVNEDVKKLFRKTIDKPLYLKFKNIIEKECSRYPGGSKDEETNIFWKNNSGYKGQVVCEHVCLNSSLINKGYKIFINPNIIYFR